MNQIIGFIKEKYRRLQISRKFHAESRFVDIANQDLLKLNFYQFKAGTAKFFNDRFGKTDIDLIDTPHYALAKALHGGAGADVESAEAFYRDYLFASWGVDEVTEELRNKIQNFRRHFDFIKSNGLNTLPVVTSFGDTGELFVVDGNHRFSIASVLGLDVRARWVPAEIAFKKYVKVPGFFGIRNSQPYQSVYLNRKIVVPGRRNDLIKRLEMIPRDVIHGKNILDVACNAGMSSLLSRHFGAANCLGLEVSNRLVDLAARFSMFEGAYPHVSFRTFDIDNEATSLEGVYDTGFLFSIYRHLKNPSALNQIVERNIKSYVVFEGHTGDQKSYYQEFFSSGLFKSVDEIGRLDTSVTKRDQSRTLWLCSR